MTLQRYRGSKPAINPRPTVGPSMIDRRLFLAGATGTMLSIAVGTAFRQATAAAAPAASDSTARLNALFDAFMHERFKENPELVTVLGLDKDKNVWAKSRLTDASVAHAHQVKRNNAARLKRLRAFGQGSLSGADRANYDTVEFQMETIARSEPFDYGDVGRPYVLSQLTGAYQSVPTFLDRQHQIAVKEDAEAYLARLRAFALVLDQETERLRHDAALKVVPPDFLIERTLEQMRTLRSASPADSILSTSLARRTQQLGLTGNYGKEAAHLVGAEVYPALDRQAKALGELRPRAVHEASVRRLPEGAEFYQLALRHSTTTDMAADEVHALGLEQAKALSASMDALLRSQGRSNGSVAERAQALAKDPQYLYANSDTGRQQILDYCNGLIKALQPHLSQYFRILPKAPVEIRRVPAYTEAGAPGGYYQIPALDGSRPGAFYINLRDTSEWPRWKLPTLVYHESEPGHHFQLAQVLELPSLPLIRKAGGGFSANTEGWALYAEQLCDEMGMYANDPLGRLGMLQSGLFRAARCVVDTGLHSKGWSREQAIDYMVQTTGDNRSSMTTEVERYCTWPGQATSYKVGQTRWQALRTQARERLGAKFDIRDFHDVGLTAAPMPLSVLERVVDEWLKPGGA
ncbi:MAG TPA: DUF885 family protein [Steroidobacteraceae bacterium]|nr:DUF885 family protein [Steroidobacteraceae bacterium]